MIAHRDPPQCRFLRSAVGIFSHRHPKPARVSCRPSISGPRGPCIPRRRAEGRADTRPPMSRDRGAAPRAKRIYGSLPEYISEKYRNDRDPRHRHARVLWAEWRDCFLLELYFPPASSTRRMAGPFFPLGRSPRTPQRARPDFRKKRIFVGKSGKRCRFSRWTNTPDAASSPLPTSSSSSASSPNSGLGGPIWRARREAKSSRNGCRRPTIEIKTGRSRFF